MRAGAVLICVFLVGASFAGFVNSDKPVVVWGEGKKVQYYFANSCIKPYSLARRFKELGIYAEVWGEEEIAEKGLDAGRVAVFVDVYGSTFPYKAKDALLAYHKNGGNLVATGVPFSKPARDFGKIFLVDGALEGEFEGDWLGVGLAQDVEGVRVIEYVKDDDPIGLGYIDFAGMRAKNVPCLDPKSLGDGAQVAGIVKLRGDSGEGFAVALIEHSDKYKGAMDLWVGSLLFEEPYPSKVAGAEAVIVQGTAYILWKKGIITSDCYARTCKETRERYEGLIEGTQARFVEVSRKYRGMLPEGKGEVKSRITVIDMRNCGSRELAWAVGSLQGLLNRKAPSVYVIWRDRDEFWLKKLKEMGFVRGYEFLSPEYFLRKYSGAAKGVVVPPDVEISWVAVGGVAGLKDAIIGSPEIAEELGLPVIYDLRGKFRNNAEVLEWVYDNFFCELDRSVLVNVEASSVAMIDYVVQNKLPAFWISGHDDREDTASVDEYAIVAKILANTAPNIPVIGGFGGLGEMNIITLFNEYGKFHVGCLGTGNLSFRTALEGGKFSQKIPEECRVPLEEDKVYLAINISDGDNLNVWRHHHFRRHLWDSQARGEIPIGWSMGPIICEMMPDIARYIYKTATPNDEFITGVSGLGYTYPRVYGINYGERQEDIQREYARLTGEYMGIMDMVTMTVHHHSPFGMTDERELKIFAEEIPFLAAVYNGYGKVWQEYEGADYMVGRVPVFLSLTMGVTEGLADEIRKLTPQVRPAFVHVFILNWRTSIEGLVRELESLGDEYRVVLPRDMGLLYREAMERKD